MRYTEFWQRMRLVLGDGYAESWAADVALSGLGGRTAAAALAEGESAREVWDAVCRALEVDPTSAVPAIL